MTAARRTPRQADISRVVRAGIKAGLPAGSFTIEVVGETVRLLPIAANSALNAADDAERRMREAFGE
ncbi:hypothetical protein [Phenylobacterium sp.]|jgi:hypothetical protein|uniref:hypothetical protein n=1 Tax=Phenylobacterium sp. TaxID=1871053 RepID=UPI00403622D9